MIRAVARILLVDSDETFLEILGDFLSGRGHTVSCCADPGEAPALADREAPELIITDYEMPRLNGSELVARLRNAAKFHDLPVLFLSGVDALHYAPNMPPDRRVRFLRKPVDLSELEGAIKALLDPEGWSKSK